jgi:TorA maturation chaperone TorD
MNDARPELLHESARWRILGLLFRRPNAARCRELAQLACESGDADLIRADEVAASITEGQYQAWLGPGGPLSPREVSYRTVEDPGRILAEIGAFHRAFAYRTDGEDPVDHVAVLADFVAYLALKEAYALSSTREHEATITREARERFVERHVRPVARGMARRLSHVADDVSTAHFLVAVDRLSRLARADVGTDETVDAPFLPPGLDDESFPCGGCPASNVSGKE